MPKIAVVGWQHETNTYSPIKTTLADFLQPDCWPELLEGDAVLSMDLEANLPMAGFIAAAKDQFDLWPVVWCSATPSGVVEDVAAHKILEIILKGIKANLNQLAAIYLDLHGAMISESHDDMEGYLLAKIRALVGCDIPIVCSLDLHANVSQSMVDLSDGLIIYRTYPHIDMRETGARAFQFLQSVLVERKKYYKAFKQVPYLIPLTAQCTDIEPAKSLYALCEGWDGVAMGFPLANCADRGPSIVCYEASEQLAHHKAEKIYQQFLVKQKQFTLKLLSAKLAVSKAAKLALQAVKPIIIVDTQDNPGCGGSSDTTGILSELIKQRVSSALVVSMTEPMIAQQAHAAGVGACITAIFQDKHNCPSTPLSLLCQIEALGDGNIVGTGPFYLNCHFALGPMTLLNYQGIRIIVTSKKIQAADQALIRCLGVEPCQEKILVLKSSVHYRADFSSLAETIIVAEAPGLNIADPEKL